MPQCSCGDADGEEGFGSDAPEARELRAGPYACSVASPSCSVKTYVEARVAPARGLTLLQELEYHVGETERVP